MADNGDLDYIRLPSFFKHFSEARSMEELRLPPEWVRIHGGDLSFQCKLRDNRIVHGDFLTFMLVDVGKFQVERYNPGTRCPPHSDIESEFMVN
ncbi:B3 domain-containing protein REM20-like [Salvia divinorum]|uniref:B3 domain-containing protein REM20-like n=1 Tax=Salvia divinorum TaxID=28513 RepID=A0ABD1GQ45_SALDI